MRPVLSRSVTGLSALVTGAGGGMGEATACLLAKEGARVALIDIKADEVERVAREIVADRGTARAFVADLADAAAIAKTVSEIAAWAGGIDLVVNNAGISIHCPIDSPDYDERFALSSG